jgi:L-lactate dehydrogenase complex protein LldG
VINVTKSTIGPTIQDVLNQRGIEKLLYGKNTDYSSLLETELNPQKNIELIPFDFNLNENKAFVFNDLPASFTSSKFAIADTGTVVLWPSIEEPRTMSLIPPLHIVAVQTKSLYQNFANLVEAQNWKAQMPTNILLVSGPSKTADIQQTLAYGAHGPKELIVLLIED